MASLAMLQRKPNKKEVGELKLSSGTTLASVTLVQDLEVEGEKPMHWLLPH